MSHTPAYSEHSALLGDVDSAAERGEQPKASTSQGGASFYITEGLYELTLCSWRSKLEGGQNEILSSVYDVDTKLLYISVSGATLLKCGNQPTNYSFKRPKIRKRLHWWIIRSVHPYSSVNLICHVTCSSRCPLWTRTSTCFSKVKLSLKVVYSLPPPFRASYTLYLGHVDNLVLLQKPRLRF